MPRCRRARGWIASRLARRVAEGWRARTGDDSGRSEEQLIDPRGWAWRNLADAAQAKTAGGENRGTCRMGAAGRSVARSTVGPRRAPIDRERPFDHATHEFHRRAAIALGTATDRVPSCSVRRTSRLAAIATRRMDPGAARESGNRSVIAGKPQCAPASIELRPNRVAARPGRGRRVRRQRLARRALARRRPLACVASIRRALWPPLARSGPLRRFERIGRKPRLCERLPLPRLCDRGFQSRQTV